MLLDELMVERCEAEPIQRQLLTRFYQTHKAHLTRTPNSQIWVARSSAIIAAVCLSEVADGHWLTSLLVAPQARRQGVAGKLLHAIRTHYQGPIWLFCKPELAHFYQRHNFHPTQQLPSNLAQRLVRYQQSKPLIALLNEVIQ